jgi:hypothetical protein
MNTVIVDRAASEKLRAAGNGTESRDEAGELIGFLNKPRQYTDAEIGWPTQEEIERRLREGRRHTPDEVMAHLRKLEEGLK